jgi:hypothetical protein
MLTLDDQAKIAKNLIPLSSISAEELDRGRFGSKPNDRKPSQGERVITSFTTNNDAIVLFP